MAIYTYIGNLVRGERTSSIRLRGGALVLNLSEYADLTDLEYSQLKDRFQLYPGVAVGSTAAGAQSGLGDLLSPLARQELLDEVQTLFGPEVSPARLDLIDKANLAANHRHRLDDVFMGDGPVGLRLYTYRASEPFAIDLLRQLRGERYHVERLRDFGALLPGAKALHQMDARGVARPFKSVPWNDGTTSQILGAMSSNTTSPLAYNGGYGFVTTAGRGRAGAALPAGTTYLSYRSLLKANGALILCSIGGDFTKANALPTARQLVDRGVAPSSLIGTVVNGHTIVDADRIIDLEPSANTNSSVGGTDDIFDYSILCHIGEDIGGLVPQFIHTGKANIASTGTPTIYMTGYSYGDRSMTRDTAGVELLTAQWCWNTFKSANEYAFNCQPTGASASIYVGNFHGYDEEVSLAYYVDGQPVAPTTNGATIWGREIVVVRTSRLYQPNLNAGATVWADVVTYYRMTAAGLVVEPVITPRAGFNAASTAGYLAMGTFERYKLSHMWHNSDSVTTTLVGSGGRAQLKTDGMVAWSPIAGRSAQAYRCQLDDPRTMGSYINNTAPKYAGVQDNVASSASGAPNSAGGKFYAEWSSDTSPKTLMANVSYRASARHQVAAVFNPEDEFAW